MLNSLYFQEFFFKKMMEKLHSRVHCAGPELRRTAVKLLSPLSELSFY
jgi:hypothetical protein